MGGRDPTLKVLRPNFRRFFKGVLSENFFLYDESMTRLNLILARRSVEPKFSFLMLTEAFV